MNRTESRPDRPNLVAVKPTAKPIRPRHMVVDDLRQLADICDEPRIAAVMMEAADMLNVDGLSVDHVMEILRQVR